MKVAHLKFDIDKISKIQRRQPNYKNTEIPSSKTSNEKTKTKRATLQRVVKKSRRLQRAKLTMESFQRKTNHRKPK